MGVVWCIMWHGDTRYNKEGHTYVHREDRKFDSLHVNLCSGLDFHTWGQICARTGPVRFFVSLVEMILSEDYVQEEKTTP